MLSAQAEEVQRGKRIFKHLLSTLQQSGSPNEIQRQISAKQAARIAQENTDIQAEVEREKRERERGKGEERAKLLVSQSEGRSILYRPAILTMAQEEIVARQLDEHYRKYIQE